MDEAPDAFVEKPVQPEAVAEVAGIALPGDRWLAYGDAMRFLGVLGVVFVHTCDMVMFSGTATATEWWVANLADPLGRWAVPVFVMLSGALLLHPSRTESAKRFYRRRLARLGVPIVFWSAFYVLFSIHYTGWGSPAWNAPNSVWKGILRGYPYIHLHFIFRLAGLYALTPMLRVYVRHAPRTLRVSMVLLLLGLGVGNWAVTAVLGSQTTAFSALWSFLAFYLLGEVLRGVQVSRRLCAWSCAGFIVCCLGISGATGLVVHPSYDTFRPFPSVDAMFYDYLCPLRFMSAVFAWFVLASVFRARDSKSRAQRVAARLAPLTLGVYLVHPLFREILYKEGWLFARPNVWVGIPATFAVIAALSIAAAFVIRLIPGVRRIGG